MLGTLVNTGAVLAGSMVGIGMRRLARAPARAIADSGSGGSADLAEYQSPTARIALQGLGLVTVALGIKMALETRQVLIVILSIVLGGVIGQALGIEQACERLALKLKQLSASSESKFVVGFVTASVLFCVGPMTILGSIQDGLQRDSRLLLVKSLMDCVSSVILATTFGVGVFFSALAVLVIQGLLTVLAAQLQFLVLPSYLSEFTATGGIMITAIGIRLAGIRDIKAGNLLPALVLAVLLVFFGKALHWLG